MSNHSKYQRKSIRFKPEDNTLVYIKSLNSLENEIDCIGLVSNEAGKGFGCIVLKDKAPSIGDVCMVKVGELAAEKANVVYRNDMDDDAVKLGFEYT